MIPCYGNPGSRQRIIEYKIWVLAAEAYSYVVQFRPYHGAKKGKQVASCTKQGLGENVALRLMECLTPTVSFDMILIYLLMSISFVQQVCSTKIGYANAQSQGTNNCKKRNSATLNSVHQAEKQCNFDSVSLERQQGDLYSFFI